MQKKKDSIHKHEVMGRREFLIKTGGALAGLVASAALPNQLLGSTSAKQEGDASKFMRSDDMALSLAESIVVNTNGFVESPRIASDGNENAWLVWLNRLPGNDERICFCEYREKWSAGAPIAGSAGQIESPVIACAPGGTPMAVWVKIAEGKWTLVSSAYSHGLFGLPVDVPSGSGKAANPSLAVGVKGDYWLAWESYHNGRFRILLTHYSNGKWENPIEVTDGSSNSYAPALAIDAKSGNVWLAYAGVDNNKQYSIYLKSLDSSTRKLSDPVAVGVGGCMVHRPNLNKYPSIICDGEGRVWVAYERDSVRGVRYANDDNHSMGPHMGSRECSVVCYQSGQLYHVTAGPSNVGGREVLAGANDHYPTLIQDLCGRIWVFSRDSVANTIYGQSPWNMRASYLNGAKGWTSPSSLLDVTNIGRLSRPAVAFVNGDSLWAAWQSDNLPRNWNTDTMGDEQTKINIGRITIPASDPKAGVHILQQTTANAGDKTGKTLSVRARVPRRKITEGDNQYTLLFGNLHEHTLVSRCWSDASDGTFNDDYRYGRDIEGYDFAGVSDHGFDLGIYEWRKTIRAAEFYNDAPSFVGMCGYEWTKMGEEMPVSCGHRNIYFASADDAAKFVSAVGQVYEFNLPESDTMVKVWQILRDKGIKNAVTIPHHPADKQHPMDWNFHDPYYQSVVEIFQCRESAEYSGCPRQTPNPSAIKRLYVQDALARGYKMGFVASGDHNSMGMGIACVWVKEVSQAGIIEALLARRCYATTGDKIFVDFRADGHLMGGEYQATNAPHLTARIECTQPIKEIVIFKNNQVLTRVEGSSLHSSTNYDLDYVDNSFETDSYYYVRVIQNDDEIAWASPIWVNS
ncbi:DUF3604 domain-containing protein [bacterium]|nr:DUF3604 domain-containing protein [bacterium]